MRMARKLYQRYLMREAFAAIFLILLAFVALFSFFDLINELRHVGRDGFMLGHAVLAVTLSLPNVIYELIPIAALIGTLYALSTLARHSEITVLRASGLATMDILTTLFRVAGLLALLTVLVGEILVPAAEKLEQEFMARMTGKVVAQSGFESGFWVKDGRNFINIRNAFPDARLEGVRIYHFNERNDLLSVTEVAEARYQPGDSWLLTDVVQTLVEREATRVERFDSIIWHSALSPALLEMIMVAPERMTMTSLVGYTRHLAENRQKTGRYEIAIWKKLIYPLSTLVMVALALPFGYSHNRVGGVSLKIFAGVMFGIFFYMLNGLFSNLGVINAWPPFASAIAPSALFLLAATGMIWWVERR